MGTLNVVAPDGGTVVFTSVGIFAGLQWAVEGSSTYMAGRGEAGWATTAVSSPPAMGQPIDFSADVVHTLAGGSLESKKESEPASDQEFILHRVALFSSPTAWDAESWEVAGKYVIRSPKGILNPAYVGASADLCHVFVVQKGELLPEAAGAAQQLYELASAPAGGCRASGPSSALRLVSAKNVNGAAHGEPEPIDGRCEAEPGTGAYGHPQDSDFNRFPDDGEEVFFTQSLGASCDPHELFVRLGGEKTLEVSKPLDEKCASSGEIPCLPGALARASANFAGASEDGLRVYFTTTAPLTASDTDTGNDLYLATLGCPGGELECPVAAREVVSLVQVSRALVAGQASEVQGVVRIAADGSRVYYVARGALSETPNARGESAVAGADNLYVYDASSGSTTFVADLCSGPTSSGSVEDSRCPADLDGASRNDKMLWGTQQEAQSNACGKPVVAECVGRREPGRYLLFSSYGRLTKDDTDNAKDVYLYDAVTGALVRVSAGEDGYDANGNRNDKLGSALADASTPNENGIRPDSHAYGERESSTRAIDEDGSRVVFSTAEPLSSSASNGLVNVYEWHEGQVSIVSSGNSLRGDGNPVLDPSGRDLFFLTEAQLVGRDTDEDTDLYDARIDGGFPEPALVGREECSGDGCQGALSVPVPLLVPGSVSQAPGENVPVPKTPVKKQTSTHAKKKPKARAGKGARHKTRKGHASKRVRRLAVGGRQGKGHGHA